MPKRKRAKVAAKPVEPVEKKPSESEPDIRSYLDLAVVSQHLFCSICAEVFVHPQRAPCGHSYCKDCILQWLNTSQTCPEDRKILKPDQLHHDFILENIIMDQQVACPHRSFGCSYFGPLSNLKHHMKDCTFDPANIPQFLQNEMKQAADLNAEDGGDSPQKSSYLPLKMRLFQAGGQKRENLVNVFGNTNEGRSKITQLLDLLDE